MRWAAGRSSLADWRVYAFATLGCAIAGNIETLWLFRTAQGISAGTGMVVGRAIIRDRFQGAEAQRLMAQVTLVFSIAPAIAPIIGGALLNMLGWRSIFWVLLLWVLVVLAWSTRYLPETLHPSHRHVLRPSVLWRNYAKVLAEPRFTMLTLIPTLNFAAFFIYIAVAPAFLVELLGVSTWGFAWLFVPMITGIVAGATLSGRMAGRISPQRTIRFGYMFIAAGAVANVLICHFAPPFVAWNVAPILDLRDGKRAGGAERDAGAARPVSDDARARVVAAGLRAILRRGHRGRNRRAAARAFADGAGAGAWPRSPWQASSRGFSTSAMRAQP